MLMLWAASVLARSTQRISGFRLLFFFAFIQVSVAEDLGYMLLSQHWIDFTPVQREASPWVAGFRILAALEAFWWLASSLPKFRRVGSALMVLCAVAAWWSSSAVETKAGTIQHLEVTIAFGLVAFLGATLLIHKAIGTEAESAMWHAGMFGLVAMCQGCGWYFMRSPWLGASIMFGGQIVAAIIWKFTVSQPPTWRSPEPVGTREEVIRLINEIWP